jgi:nitroreductase
LLTRRSVRQFTPELPSEELLEKIFELCRFAPTSMNSESYYFIIIKDREVQQHLSEVRGSSSTPIARAPLAVAICADSDKTKRPEQDGCIAAYHFLLCAWEYGLGSCWIADMDRTQVKELLNIPQEHYVATVTPLGFPSRFEEAPVRRRAGEMVRSLG